MDTPLFTSLRKNPVAAVLVHLLRSLQVILAEGPFFTGSTLKLRANRDLSSEFDLIRAIAGPKDVRKRGVRCVIDVHLNFSEIALRL